MKTKNFLFPALMLFSVISWAQETTPRADVRQGAQRARIHEGRATGDLTNKEAAALNSEQRHIRRAERRVKADGDVTTSERRSLERKQNRANRHIRRTKHNEATQPN